MFSCREKTFLATIILLSSICHAQHNITVRNTSPSIQYDGNAKDAPICRFVNGTYIPGQPGCYLISPPCTDSVTMGQGGSGAASFYFKGSAIYVTSALNSLSPIYTVDLDGTSTDVDGVRPSAPFTCHTLFSQTGLDPSAEHRIRLSVKGPSPTRNQTIPDSENYFVFSLINFIYTEEDSRNTATAVASTLPNSAEIQQHHIAVVFGAVLISSFFAIGLY